MLSIRYNSRIKLWRNRKTSWKNAKIKPFIDKSNCEGINYPSEKDNSKKIDKNNLTIALNVLHAKKEKYILPMFQNITPIVKKSYSFTSKEWWVRATRFEPTTT